MAYSDYEDMMRMTEEIVSGMVLKLKVIFKPYTPYTLHPTP
jgi:lysyl-tRNA synthetase class II